MKQSTLFVSGVVIVILLFLSLIGFVIYRFFPTMWLFEPYRARVDTALVELGRNDTSNFEAAPETQENPDKYVDRPARIVPDRDADGSYKGFVVYGLVTKWDPEGKVLSLDAYTGNKLFVRLDPDTDRSLIVIPKLDKLGVAVDSSMQVVTSASEPNWSTLFCYADIVSVHTTTADAITASSEEYPLIPKRVQLSHRLCEQ